MRIHPDVTIARVVEAVRRYNTSLDNPGFCVSCGHEADGCEPDMRRGYCEACGDDMVFGAEELLHRMAW